MDTCTTCGATLRPGARFCTTCGTRVNTPTSTDGNGWGTVARAADTDDQQTSLLTPVNAPESAAESPSFTTDRVRGWGDAWGTTPAESSDPASRFVTALDNDVKPVDDTGWGTSDSTSDNEQAYSTWSFSNEEPADPVWQAPASWGTSQTDDDSDTNEAISEPDRSAETPDDEEIIEVVTEAEIVDALDVLSVEDAVDHVVDDAIADIPKEDPRHRIMSLLGELQQLVPQIAVISTDEGTAAMTLTEASLNAGEYADLREVINVVKDDPRDIQALGELAGKIDRIEALLEEHTALTTAIESALHDLGSK